MIDSDSSAVVLESGPLDALTDVPGVAVGHYTDERVYRGVTAILTTGGATAGVSVRGSNPGTIHTDALGPTTIGGYVHGIGLSGGSLFGLGAIAGITEWLLQQGIGLQLKSALIPIVPGAVIYDMDLTDPMVHPRAEWGHQAAAAATSGAFERGNVGAGRGGTAGKGPGGVRTKGGLGTASLMLPGGIVVGALVVINALGSMVHPETVNSTPPAAASISPCSTSQAMPTRCIRPRWRTRPSASSRPMPRSRVRRWSRSPIWPTMGSPARSGRCMPCATATPCSRSRRTPTLERYPAPPDRT